MTVKHIDFIGDRSPTNTALIVIDVQRAFTESSLFGIASAQSVLDNINGAVDRSRELGIPVIWVRYQVRSEVGLGLTSKRYDVEDLHTGEGTEIDPRLHFLPTDEVIIKPRQSAFYGTDLEYLLRSKGVKYLCIAGVTTNVCVLAVVKDASERDFAVNLLEDCTAALPILHNDEEIMSASEVQNASVNFMRWAYGPVSKYKEAFDQISSNKSVASIIPKENSALVIIDLQNTFTQKSSKLSVENAQEIIDINNKLAEKARKKGFPVIWVKRQDRLSVGPGVTASRYGRTGIHRDNGAEFDDRIQIKQGDLTLTKRRQSSFYSTDLEIILRGFNVSKLYISGVTTNVCVLGTAKDAAERDFEVNIVEDATASLGIDVENETRLSSAETQFAGINFIAWAYGKIVNSKDIFN
jgi:nicotinamidase-related amidase